jgi:hypothetical protein
LNAAVHDDELSFESIAPPGFQLKVCKTAQGPFIPVGGMRILRMTSTLQTDYYIYCMTDAAAHRLFDDFDADACVAVTKPKDFLDRLIAAVKTTLPEFQPGVGK